LVLDSGDIEEDERVWEEIREFERGRKDQIMKMRNKREAKDFCREKEEVEELERK